MPTQDLVFRFIGLDTSAGKSFDELGAKAESTGKSFAKFAAGTAVVAGVIAAASIDMAAKFQASTELMRTQAGATQDQVDSYRKAILGLAGETATAPLALSDAMFHLVSTGVQGAQAINELKIAAEGAKVGGADLTDVTNALNSTIVSGIGGVKTYSQAMGALNTIVGTGDMHMEDLAQALGTGVLPIIKAFGVNLPQAGAALAVFGDNNIRGAQAATQLRMAVQALAKPVQGATGAFAELGLKGSDALNHFAVDMQTGGLQKALTDLHTRLVETGNTGSKTGSILVDAFGKRAGTGIAVLVEEYGRFETKLDEIKQGSGSFGADWTATTKNLSFQFERLHADVDVLAIKIGDDLIPAAMLGIHGIEGLGNAAVATTDFFAKNQAATLALAGVLGATLAPAAIEAGASLAVAGYRTLAINAIYAKGALTAMAAAFTDMGTSAKVAYVEATAGLALIAVAGVEAWEQVRDREKSATQYAQQYVAALKIDDNSFQSINAGTAALTRQIAAWKAISNPMGVTNGITGALQKQLTGLTAKQKMVAINTRDMGTEFGMTSAQVAGLANKIGPGLLAGSTQDAESAFIKATAAANATKDATKVAGNAFQTMGDQSQTATSDLNALTTAFDALLGNFLNVKQAQLDFKNDLVTLTGDLKKSHDSLTLNTAAGRESRGAYISLAQQIETTATAVYKQTGSTNDARKATATMRAELAKMPATGALVTQTLHKIESVLSGLDSAATVTGHRFGANLAAAIAAERASAVGAAQETVAQIEDILSGGSKAIAHGIGQGPQAHNDNSNAVTANAMLSYADGSAFLSAAQHAGPKLNKAGKLLYDGLTGGFKGTEETLFHSLPQAMQNSLDALQAKADKIQQKAQANAKAALSARNADLASRKADITSLQASIAGNDLSGLFGTDVNGNPTVANLGITLSGQASQVKQFANLMGLAAKKGLSPALLQQIAALGPAEGIQVLQQILSGADGSVRSLNASESAIQHYAKQTATTVEDKLYAGELKRANTKLDKANDHLHSIDAHLREIERRAAHEVSTNVIVKDGKITKLTTAEARIIDAALKRLRKRGLSK